MNKKEDIVAKNFGVLKTIFILCGLIFINISLAEQINAEADPYTKWGPPYRVLYGGYSMKPDDWELVSGTFNLIHHSLLGKSPDEIREILNQAKKYKMKIITTIPIWDPDTGEIDEYKLNKLRKFIEIFSKDQAIFGYVYEAAYRIPPDKQKEIYAIVKKLDPSRPVWCEFSSTSFNTWKLFNPDACDALFTYNYPYEITDKDDSVVNRIRYSVNAIKKVGADKLPVIPILQAFRGARWRIVPKGGMASQFSLWLELPKIAGVSFYRWRGRKPYYGLLEDGSENNYAWTEVKILCRQIAQQSGPFVNREKWYKVLKTSQALNVIE